MATLIEIVKEYADKADFSIGTYEDDLDYVTEDFCDQVVTAAHKAGLGVDYQYGATQLCFIDEGNEDYVVKMPFVNKSFCRWEEDDEGQEYEEEVTERYFHDYTAECADLYDKACKAGVAMFFAKVDSIGSGAWTQEYVISLGEGGSPRQHSEAVIKLVTKMSKEHDWKFHPTWIADCLLYYGREAFNKFIDFIKEEKINDLHGGNYGWTKSGYPRLLDYAGYHE